MMHQRDLYVVFGKRDRVFERGIVIVDYDYVFVCIDWSGCVEDLTVFERC